MFEDNKMIWLIRTHALVLDYLGSYFTLAAMRDWASYSVSLGLSFPIYILAVLPKLST